MAQGSISELLAAVERHEPTAWDRLMPLVYVDLKRLAHSQMRRMAPGQTLSTTVLVHEAFEKLAAQRALPVRDRGAFLGLCAHAMRQIIIDHYRRRQAAKRLPDEPGAFAEHERRRANPGAEAALERLGHVLAEMQHHDHRMLEAFELRYLAGMSEAEVAMRMDLPLRSVQRLCARTRAWIVTGMEAPET